MKFLKNVKLSVRVSSIILVVTLTGMTALWLIISQNVTSIVKENISNQMYDAVTSRAAIIQNYVSGAENTMTEFALGTEVKTLLKNPDDPAAVAAAQELIDQFARLTLTEAMDNIGSSSAKIRWSTKSTTISPRLPAQFRQTPQPPRKARLFPSSFRDRRECSRTLSAGSISDNFHSAAA